MMKFKKVISTVLAFGMVMSVLTGCGSQVAQKKETSAATEAAETTETAGAEETAGAVKTGLSMITSVAKSKDATADEDGVAQTNIALVAVTVDDEGVIDHCVIDMIQAKINFNAAGELTTDAATTFASKNELGDDYGMRKASSIGKEWNEQAEAMAAYAVGKTVDELKGIAVNEEGAPTDEDLAASVTLEIADFISGIEDAVNNAEHLGAQKGDALKLVSETTMSKSASAAADAEGVAQAYANVAAVTANGETITSCYIDAVQANVKFDTTGKITTDLAAEILTKNELGDDYGMRKASSIGKEWNEQAEAFAAYATGKTFSEVAGIAVNEDGQAADEDLAASVTLSLGAFQNLIAKAAN